MPEKGQRFGDYLLREKIGEGGFGEVWEAHHNSIDQKVAIKIPTDPEFVEQLRREGSIQRALRHENIVQTLELDTSADPPYFIMELVEGRSLRQLIQQRDSLSLHEALEIGLQVLSALQFAHEKGVVHRDVKPGNILVSAGSGSGSGRYLVKVADFGLGHVSESLASSMMVSGRKTSSTGRNLSGTMDYMSPEQKMGNPADARNDLYSFGLVFYEMLAGKLPVGAFPYPSEIYPDIPAKVDEFLRRCLSPEAANRFSDSLEARNFLGNLGGGESQGTPFVLANGKEVFRLGELVAAIEESPEEGRYPLYEGDLSSWLRSIREKSLARLADRIRREEADSEVGVQKFIEGSGMVPIPGLDLDVHELDLGEISPGSNRTFKIHFSRVGRGILWGKAVAEESPPWVRPGYVYFKGIRASVEFTLVTRELSRNLAYEVRIRMESNGGVKTVPVRFRTGAGRAKLVCLQRELQVPLSGRAVLVLNNTGAELLTWRAYGYPRWLDVPSSGHISPGESKRIPVKIQVRGGAGKDLECRLMLRSNGGETSVRIKSTTR